VGLSSTIGIQGTFTGGTFTPVNYEVEVNQGPNFITQLTNDVISTVGTASLQQTTVPAGSPSPITLTQTNNVTTGNPTANYSGTVTDLQVNNTFLRAIDSNSTGFDNEILQQVPEPASGETVVVALAGLAFGYRKLKSRRS
jgi:hypothetical protein